MLPNAIWTNQGFWILTRASGVLALALMFLSAVAGIAIRSGLLDRLMVRWDVNDLHRFTSWLGFGFLAAHVASLLGDRFVGFTVGDVLVPFQSSYAEPWTGLGVVAFYLLVIVQATSYMTRSVRYAWWLAWHRLTYLAIPLTLLHVVGTGTDRRTVWLLLVMGISPVAMVLAVVHRRRTRTRGWRTEAR